MSTAAVAVPKRTTASSPPLNRRERRHPSAAGERYVGIQDAADHYGTTVRHVRHLVYERRLPHYKLGKLLRFLLSDLDDYMVENRRGGDAA